MNNDELIYFMKKNYGNSSKESRDGVINAHGGIDNLKQFAQMWAESHSVNSSDNLIAYATAVDLGYRMAKVGEFSPIDSEG